MTKTVWGNRGLRYAVAMVAALAGAAAGAQQLYRCGASYQDRPCADQEVQKRYTAGRFAAERVNPDTDKECARLVGDVMPYWMRMRKGERLETLRTEYDARPVPQEDRGPTRELLLALKGLEGTPSAARSQLETQCMANRKGKGPTAAKNPA